MNVHLVPLIATKVVLVVIAAFAEQALEHHSASHPSLSVAIGLGVVVCVAGLAGDRYFFSSSSADAGQPSKDT